MENINLPSVLCVTATCGRHTLMERSLRLYLEQDYAGKSTLLIYNNSPIGQDLAVDKLQLNENQEVILINNNIDSLTNSPYSNLGAIYNDIIKYISLDKYRLVCHWD